MSDDNDDASKTEDPTGKRLSDARERGQVVQSRDVSSLIILTTSALVLLVLAPPIVERIMRLTVPFFEQSYRIHLDDANFHALMADIAMGLGIALLVPGVLLMAAAFFSGYLQFGLVFSTEKFKFDLSKLSPFKGLKNLISIRAVVELIKSMVKIAAVSAVAYAILMPEARRIESSINIEVGVLLERLVAISARLFIGVLVLLAVIAAADWFYQRYKFMKEMRMTKSEVKDEYRQQEGDPMIKSKLRQIRMERARRRMMAAVPQATVVVTNPTHYAVALKYDQTMMAPKLVAKGTDLVALRIREIAKENFVPIVENPPVARALFAMVDLDEDIPEEHYMAVAEIIGYVFRLKKNAAH